MSQSSPDSAEYTNEQIAERMMQTYQVCQDRWFKIAADRLRALQPATPTVDECCKGLAPAFECRCEIERKAAGHPPYQRYSAANASDWRDDPTADERWNAGCDFALEQLGKYLSIDLSSINWDGATETVEGDIEAVIGNILRAKFGEDWGPDDAAQPSWRPIETAPKDGTPMLLTWWDDDTQDMLPVTSGFWSRLSDRWYSEISRSGCRPTHWMPLPGSPLSSTHQSSNSGAPQQPRGEPAQTNATQPAGSPNTTALTSPERNTP